MTPQTLQHILTRAVNDAAFADLLFADPERALTDNDLTPEEVLLLKQMSRTDLFQYAFPPRPQGISITAAKFNYQRSTK